MAVRPSYTFPARQTQLGTTTFAAPKFGRLGWDARSHDTWPFGAPRFPETASTPSFHSVQVWSPSWGVCARSGAGRRRSSSDLPLLSWKNYGDLPPFTLSVLGVAVDDPARAIAEEVALSFADGVGRWFVARRKDRRWTCNYSPARQGLRAGDDAVLAGRLDLSEEGRQAGARGGAEAGSGGLDD